MGIFYIKPADQDIIYELSATEQIQITHSASVTKKRVEEGADVSDNSVAQNVTGSFQGILSHLKLYSVKDKSFLQNLISVPSFITNLFGSSSDNGGPASLEAYFQGLRQLQVDRSFITVYYDERFAPLENCILTNVNYSRDKDTGKGFRVQLNFEQTRVRARAVQTEIDMPQSNPDLTGDGGPTSGSSTEDAGPAKTLFGSIISGGGDLIGDALGGEDGN